MLQLGYVSRRFLYEKDKEVLMEEKMPAAGKRKYMEVLKEKFAAFKGNMKIHLSVSLSHRGVSGCLPCCLFF